MIRSNQQQQSNVNISHAHAHPHPNGFSIDAPEVVVPITQQQLMKQPQLVIIRQNSLSQECISKNGIQKKVHVVVKNQPFLIQVGLLSNFVVDGQSVDFSRFPIEARLLYDNESLKEVDFVKLKPMDIKTHINERGDQVTAEIRVKVLTSQLEDMLFRIRLSATHPITKNRIEQLSVISEPIKVVSKPEQIKKKKTNPPLPSSNLPINPLVATLNAMQPLNPLNTHIMQQQINNQKKNLPPPPPPKKDVNELLGEALQRIEDMANQHAQLLSQICNTTQYHQLNLLQLLNIDALPTQITQQQQQQNLTQNQNTTQNQQTQQQLVIQNVNPVPIKEEPKKMEIEEPPAPLTPFESSFKTFMQSYNRLSYDERPGKVRRVMNQTSAKDAEMFLELLDRCQSEASAPKAKKKKNDGVGVVDGLSCDCEDCPHKKELERIDEFYNEFLSTPDVLPL